MEATKPALGSSVSTFATSPGLTGGVLGKPLERLLGIDKIDRIYAETRRETHLTGEAFLEAALARLEVKVKLEPGLGGVPTEGTLVIVANHPYGGIEGLALVRELMRVRPDVKVMANGLLKCIAELDDFSIWVDPFGGEGSKRTNLEPLRKALRHLREGGALLVFPAGEVSHLHARERAVLDPPWQPSTARLVRLTGATVLPMYVVGRNSNLFQIAGLVSPLLRTALLPRELLARRATTLEVRVGRPITREQMDLYADPKRLLGFLRLATYALADADRKPKALAEPRAKPVPVANAADSLVIAREIANLPEQALLHSSLEFEVYCAKAPEIPTVMHELGRLRELAFRAAGEGTGQAIDLDAFDEHYEHLFLWDKKTCEIIGAYRIGHTQKLLETFGEQGLYTRSLFHYKRRFLEDLGPSIELGRAFVAPARQKNHMPLLLLWQGVGRYLARHPECTTLFGPVSISADYSPVSRYVMARRLLATTAPFRRGRVLSRGPSGNFRMPRRTIAGVDLESLADLAGNIEELGRLISAIEPAGHGLPVLLRQYLKLNGRVLAFNMDEAFGNSLDALLVVDLRECDPRIRARVLGREGDRRFCEAHGLEREPGPPEPAAA